MNLPLPPPLFLRKSRSAFHVFLPGLAAAVLALWAPLALGDDAPWEVLSDGSVPEVALALSLSVNDSGDARTMTFRVRVGEMQPGWPRPSVKLGVAAARTVILEDKAADVRHRDGGWFYAFTLPAPKGGADFRRALMVEWRNAGGQTVASQNFFMPRPSPVFDDIAVSPETWGVFSMAEHERRLALLGQRIVIPLEQPLDGKASVVIENAGGRRVRNLVSGKSFEKGRHEIVWDGLDEAGAVVAPGPYRWRAVSHPGIVPELLMWFYIPGDTPWENNATSAWMGEHSNPASVAAHGGKILLGSPQAEVGYNLVLTDLDGAKKAHAKMSWFVGLGDLQVALGPGRMFALSEGFAHYNTVWKEDDGRQYMHGNLVLLAWDHEGRPKPFNGKNGERVVRSYKKPLDEIPGYRRKFSVGNLRGALWLGSRLYVSLHNESMILILNPENGAELGRIQVKDTGPLATDGRAIYGVQGTPETGFGVFRIASPAPGAKAEHLFAVALSRPQPAFDAYGKKWPVATALAASPAGELFIADNGIDQNIKVHAADGAKKGALLREIGARGGRAPRGPWTPGSLLMPFGLALDSRNQLWLAENEPTPRRISIWNPDTGVVTRELFGPACYGGTGAGFDPLDASRWLAGGMAWDVDFAAKTARIRSVLHHQTKPGQFAGPAPGQTAEVSGGNNVQIIHHGGRTFFLTKGRCLKLFELLPDDGGARLWAVLGNLASWQSSTPRWAVPEIFTKHPKLAAELSAFKRPDGHFLDLLNNDSEKGSRYAARYNVLWIDRNGDEVAQVEELQVSGPDGDRLNVPYWGSFNLDLDLEFLVERKNDWARTTLKLHGFLPSGAPDYRLDDVTTEAVGIKNYAPKDLQFTMADRHGRLLVNATPLAAIDPDGSLRWTMRNDWPGVHGSHRAPLPETGLLQGPLSFLGCAPLDEQGDVSVINGNYGRSYAITTDGLYLDEFFKDLRITTKADATRQGGEVFGGYFGRDEKTGRHFLHYGKRSFQIFEMRGLDKITRSGGTLDVTEQQVLAAQHAQGGGGGMVAKRPKR
ncbi:MAG: hypothetical protein LBK99_03990, partial [Opitutaceae bacterium]|nr:hypothetical protein [Opitutaceae bacterium]